MFLTSICRLVVDIWAFRHAYVLWLLLSKKYWFTFLTWGVWTINPYRFVIWGIWAWNTTKSVTFTGLDTHTNSTTHKLKIANTWFFKSTDPSGLYYKHITIINDDSSVVNKWRVSRSDDTTVIIYNRKMFIIQTPDHRKLKKKIDSTFFPEICRVNKFEWQLVNKILHFYSIS